MSLPLLEILGIGMKWPVGITNLVIGLVLVATSASAQVDVERTPPVEVSLEIDHQVVAPHEMFNVGVRWRIAEGWHIYWKNPGNTGRATTLEFGSKDSRVRFEDVQFPAPEVFDADRIEDLGYGHTGSPLFFAPAVVVRGGDVDSVSITAKVDWLACRKTCISGRRTLETTIRVGQTAVPDPTAKARFEGASAMVARVAGPDSYSVADIRLSDDRMEFTFEVDEGELLLRLMPVFPGGVDCKLVDFDVLNGQSGGLTAKMAVVGSQCLNGFGLVGLPAPGTVESTHAIEYPVVITEKSAPVASQDGAKSSHQAISSPPSPVPVVVPLYVYLLALLGGLLLNVMPCVLPVILHKIFHFTRMASQAGEGSDGRKIMMSHGLAYSAGVIVTMAVLAGVVLVLRGIGHEVGWGFQFQSRGFLFAMIVLLWVFGLGMLGVFSMRLDSEGSHLEDVKKLYKLERKSPLLGSVLTGLVVTFLGTPCTAPFLGPAMGFAMAAPPVSAVLLFMMVGVGLSLPFVVLAFFNGWVKWLPRKWGDGWFAKAYKGLGFLLVATMAWLLTVLFEAHGERMASYTVWILLAIGVAVWVYGVVIDQTSTGIRKRLVSAFVLIVAVSAMGVWAWPSADDVSTDQRYEWEPFSVESIEHWTQKGRPVFLDLTAKWCLNCKTNHRLVIDTDAMEKWVDDHDVVMMRGDFTSEDPAILALIRRLGRAGVPVNAVFSPSRDIEDATVLPELLTHGAIDGAL